MSVRADDEDTEYQTVGVDAAEIKRYAAVTVEDSEVLIYDRDNEDAWIQSPTACSLEAML